MCKRASSFDISADSCKKSAARITKSISVNKRIEATGTGIYMVVTDSTGVLGNGGIVGGVPVAFIGQVRVAVGVK